jgi:hypothetical protein
MITTTHSTDWHDRNWWWEQSFIDETDWQSLGEAAAEVMYLVAASLAVSSS